MIASRAEVTRSTVNTHLPEVIARLEGVELDNLDLALDVTSTRQARGVVVCQEVEKCRLVLALNGLAGVVDIGFRAEPPDHDQRNVPRLGLFHQDPGEGVLFAPDV